jgi:hypothetical protein
MQLAGDSSALAGGIVTLAIAKKSRVERLRGAGAQQRPYHAGPMMLFSKSWKKMWCTVSEHGLKLYPTAKVRTHTCVCARTAHGTRTNMTRHARHV